MALKRGDLVNILSFMKSELVVVAKRTGFTESSGQTNPEEFVLSTVGIVTWADLLDRLILTWPNASTVDIDPGGRPIGCQVFINGRMLRNLRVQLPSDLDTVQINLVRAMSGG